MDIFEKVDGGMKKRASNKVSSNRTEKKQFVVHKGESNRKYINVAGERVYLRKSKK